MKDAADKVALLSKPYFLSRFGILALFVSALVQSTAFYFSPSQSTMLWLLLSVVAIAMPLVTLHFVQNKMLNPALSLVTIVASWSLGLMIWVSSANPISLWFGIYIIASYLLFSAKNALYFNVIILLISVFYLEESASYALYAALIAQVVLCNLLSNYLAKVQAGNEALLRWDSDVDCANASAMFEALDEQYSAYQRYRQSASLLILELQTETGLPAQVEAVRALVAVWQSRLRQTDQLFRYHTDLFVCLLPNTQPEQAEILAEDIVKTSASYEFSSSAAKQVAMKVNSRTASIAQLPTKEAIQTCLTARYT
jgi:GGDEF domain-containing protein